MTYLRTDDDIWSVDEVENTVQKTSFLIGFSPIDNIVDTGTPQTGYPVENLLNQATHLRWRSQDMSTDDFLLVEVNSDVNYVAFSNHNFSGCQLTVFGRTIDSPGDLVELFPEFTVPNNRPLVLEFARRSDMFRIEVRLSGTNVFGDNIKEAAVMHVGLLMRMRRGVKVDVDHMPITRGQKSDVLAGFSESGQFTGRLVRNQIWETKFEFSQIPDAMFNGSEEGAGQMTRFLQDYAPNYPFFVVWAPDQYQNDVGFVWITEDPAPTQHPITRRWALTLNTRGFSGFDN